MTGTLFTDVMIFDGSGEALFPGEVLVREDRIEAVARGDERLPRDGATIVEGKGRTLMPGMVEAHGHLTWPTSIERVINTMKPLPIEQHTLITAQNARITLDAGFTSVYSAGSLGERIEPALRNMIDAGFLPGPRLRASALEKARRACSACLRAMIRRTSAISRICASTSPRRRPMAATRSSF